MVPYFLRFWIAVMPMPPAGCSTRPKSVRSRSAARRRGQLKAERECGGGGLLLGLGGCGAAAKTSGGKPHDV